MSRCAIELYSPDLLPEFRAARARGFHSRRHQRREFALLKYVHRSSCCSARACHSSAQLRWLPSISRKERCRTED